MQLDLPLIFIFLDLRPLLSINVCLLSEFSILFIPYPTVRKTLLKHILNPSINFE